jgi:hypothetical protein
MVELPTVFPKCPVCNKPLPEVQLDADVRDIPGVHDSVEVTFCPVYPEGWDEQAAAEHPDCILD